jgi:hypothetical protein
MKWELFTKEDWGLQLEFDTRSQLEDYLEGIDWIAVTGQTLEYCKANGWISWIQTS